MSLNYLSYRQRLKATGNISTIGKQQQRAGSNNARKCPAVQGLAICSPSITIGTYQVPWKFLSQGSSNEQIQVLYVPAWT
jgi:hypothetical protein